MLQEDEFPNSSLLESLFDEAAGIHSRAFALEKYMFPTSSELARAFDFMLEDKPDEFTAELEALNPAELFLTLKQYTKTPAAISFFWKHIPNSWLIADVARECMNADYGNDYKLLGDLLARAETCGDKTRLHGYLTWAIMYQPAWS